VPAPGRTIVDARIADQRLEQFDAAVLEIVGHRVAPYGAPGELDGGDASIEVGALTTDSVFVALAS